MTWAVRHWLVRNTNGEVATDSEDDTRAGTRFVVVGNLVSRSQGALGCLLHPATVDAAAKPSGYPEMSMFHPRSARNAAARHQQGTWIDTHTLRVPYVQLLCEVNTECKRHACLPFCVAVFVAGVRVGAR